MEKVQVHISDISHKIERSLTWHSCRHSEEPGIKIECYHWRQVFHVLWRLFWWKQLINVLSCIYFNIDTFLAYWPPAPRLRFLQNFCLRCECECVLNFSASFMNFTDVQTFHSEWFRLLTPVNIIISILNNWWMAVFSFFTILHSVSALYWFFM